MDLSIIILNYRTKGLVRQALRGVLLAEPRGSYEVIVVDNASHDGCLDLVAREFPWVIRIASAKNCGFGAGNNLGMRAARGRFVLLMNPDIAVFSGQIDALLDFMAAHPRVGVVGPRLANPDGGVQDSCRRFPRLFTPIYRRTKLGQLPHARQQLDHFLMHDASRTASMPVDWLLGACLLLRREVLPDVGMFDENFFLYFEDLDFCRRCWQRGWEVWYVTTAVPVHYHQRLSASLSGVSAVLHPATWQHIRSAFHYYRKYAGLPLPKLSPSGQEAQRGVR